MKAEHQAVKEIIESGKVSQAQIAADIRWLGAHEKYEIHLPKTHESTLRKVRQIIHDLRMIYSIKIISDTQGYWIAKTEDEIKEYLTRLEQTAKAQAKSHMITYNKMKQLLSNI